MTVDDPIVARALVAVALALSLSGVFVSWTASNAVKRVGALVIAMLGAVMAAAAVGASDKLLIAAVAIAFAQLPIGAALVVRLQESYGEVETDAIDAADARDDAAGPMP